MVLIIQTVWRSKHWASTTGTKAAENPAVWCASYEMQQDGTIRPLVFQALATTSDVKNVAQ